MPIREDSLQTSSAKHPIPQNVMDVEFKVVGDITVRQFMTIVVGAVLCYIFIRSGLPSFWRYVLTGIAAISTLAVAFVPLQERTLDVWIINFIKSLVSPSQRLWIKELNPPVYFMTDYAAIIKNEIITLSPTKNRNKLEEYLSTTKTVQREEMDSNEDSRLSEIGSFLKTRKPSVQVDLSASSAKKVIPYEEIESKQNLADLVLAQNRSVDRALSSANLGINPNLTANQAVFDVDQSQQAPMGMGGGQIQQPVQQIQQPQAQPVINQAAVTTQFNANAPGNKVSYVDENEGSSSLDQIDESELHNTVAQMKNNMNDANTNRMQPPAGAAHISNIAAVQNFPVQSAQNNQPVQNSQPLPKVLTANKDANIIKGLVKDNQNGPVENATIIIKNSAGNVEYSLKTDKNGAFLSELPLSDGNYTLEVIVGNSSNLKFDIINIVANQAVIPPIIVTGRI